MRAQEGRHGPAGAASPGPGALEPRRVPRARANDLGPEHQRGRRGGSPRRLPAESGGRERAAVREQRPDILWKPSAPGLPM